MRSGKRRKGVSAVKDDEVFSPFVDLLLQWNQKINLTAITNRQDILVKHIEDSLALIQFLENTQSLVDLGSGGGFPGLVLKLALPHLHVVLVESQRKKASFLLDVISRLSLTEIHVLCARAESPEAVAAGPFDVVTSRATWKLSDFLSIALAYTHAASTIIAMKGPAVAEELSAAKHFLAEHQLHTREHRYALSNGDGRVLMIATR